jgi:hypothetical protein
MLLVRMLSVIIMSFIILGVNCFIVILSVIMLNVVMLSVVTPPLHVYVVLEVAVKEQQCRFIVYILKFYKYLKFCNKSNKKLNCLCSYNGTACFKKCEKVFEYQHSLLLGDIWWSKF